MQEWQQFSDFASQLSVIIVLALVLYLLISDRYIATKARLQEWKDRANKAEERADAAYEALRENNAELARVAERMDDSNRLQSDILRTLIEVRRQ